MPYEAGMIPPVSFKLVADSNAAIGADIDLPKKTRGLYIQGTDAAKNIAVQFSDGSDAVIQIPPLVQFPVFADKILNAGTDEPNAANKTYQLFAIL